MSRIIYIKFINRFTSKYTLHFDGFHKNGFNNNIYVNFYIINVKLVLKNHTNMKELHQKSYTNAKLFLI